MSLAVDVARHYDQDTGAVSFQPADAACERCELGVWYPKAEADTLLDTDAVRSIVTSIVYAAPEIWPLHVERLAQLVLGDHNQEVPT